jgi:hypothetical protein
MLGLGLAKNARVRVSQVLGLAKNASSSKKMVHAIVKYMLFSTFICSLNQRKCSLPFMLSCSCYCQIMLAIKIKCFNKMLYILSAVEKRN